MGKDISKKDQEKWRKDESEKAICKNTECPYYRRDKECPAALCCGGYSD